MGDTTTIEWCDKTFNPWIGCTKVSAGCTHCYAEQLMDKRGGRVVWGKGNPRQLTSVGNWRKPKQWNKEAEKLGIRYRVFCASLADVFDAEVPDEWRERLFELIHETPHLDWLLLTKRPERVLDFMDKACFPSSGCPMFPDDKLPPNVWMGTSVENQEAANKRIPYLLQIPATVRFLSCEPLLGAVDLSAFIGKYDCHACGYRGFDIGNEYECPTCEKSYTADNEKCPHCGEEGDEYATCPRCGSSEGGTGTFGTYESNPYLEETDGIHWVIAGGESGNGARPMHPDWARGLRDQCQRAGVAFLFKQWDEYLPWIPNTGNPQKRTIQHVRLDGKPYKAGDYTSPLRSMIRVGKHAAGRDLDGP